MLSWGRGGSGSGVFFLPCKQVLAKGCPTELEHQYFLGQNLTPHGAEASFKYYWPCVSNCKGNKIHTSVLISFTRTSPLPDPIETNFPCPVFEGSKRIWKFWVKKLLTFMHLWCPHQNVLQQFLLHQSHLFTLFQLPKRNWHYKNILPQKTHFINSFSPIKTLLMLPIYACLTALLKH